MADEKVEIKSEVKKTPAPKPVVKLAAKKPAVKTAPKAIKHPVINTLPELKAWLMKLTPKERQEVEGYVDKILPTLK